MLRENILTSAFFTLSVIQYSDYRSVSKAEGLESDDVHIHTKRYLQENKQADSRITNI